MIFFDLESDAIDATKIHCIAISDLKQEGVDLYGPEEIDEAVERIQSGSWICAHNAIGFDVPVLARLCNLDRSNVNVFDTVIASRLIWPDIEGGHSLEAWGVRLKENKLDFRQASIERGLIPPDAPKGAEFKEYSYLMARYCVQDVVVLKKLYLKIKEELKTHDWSKSLRLEHRIAEIMHQQEVDGWKFDVDKAHSILSIIDSETKRIDQELQPILSKNVKRIGQCMKPFKKDGTYSKAVEDYYSEECSIVGGSFSKIEFEYPNLGSRQQMVEQLVRTGWEPTVFTDKGNPKLDEDSLGTVEGEVGKLLALRFKLLKRKGDVEGWLNAVRSDGRIPARATPQGTPTGRMRHRTVVNVSKVNTDDDGHLVYYPEGKIILGTECRELFCVPEDKVQVGIDASGLELRMLAHYMGDPDFTKEVIDGDVHTKMWNTVREWVDSRSTQKNVTYAILYGAGDPKLAATAGHDDPRIGALIRENLLSGIPALGKLVGQVSFSAKKGWLKGLDGRKIPVRSEHAALNSLLQCAGSIVVKAATARMHQIINNQGLDAIQVGHFHDEAQLEAAPEDAEAAGQAFIDGLKWAEKYFKLKCPLDGEMKIGKNWATCH